MPIGEIRLHNANLQARFDWQGSPASEPPVTIPFNVRGVNVIGGVLEKVGLSLVHFDPEKLIRQAQKETGLDRFPEIDWRTPFEKLMIGYNRESNLSLVGRLFAKEMTLLSLRTMLTNQAEFDRHPEIFEVSIERPLIIVAPSRSGSTFLHKLLASHPDARSPRLWELQTPCPPPRPDIDQSDPRIRSCQEKFDRFFSLLPDFRKIHDLQPLEPDECMHIFRGIFMCRLSFSVPCDVPTYQEWVDRADFDPAYRYYKKVLRSLSLNFPGKRMILKSPTHILTLAELINVFPDAGIVMLHRDPRVTAASRCSLCEAARMFLTNDYDLEAIGHLWRSNWAPALNRVSEIRSNFSKTWFYDVDYHRLITDPVKTARDIFETFGFRYDGEVETRLRNWLVDHPKEKYGSHRYSLERYRLSSRKVLGAVEPYLSAFDLKYD